MRTKILVIASAAALCAGCFRSTTLITLRQDGSGTIEQEVGMTAQAAAMARGFRDSADEKGAKKGADLFTEADARKAGEQMGVRFVSMEPIKSAQLEGYRAKYSFDDITKLTFGRKDASAASSGSPDPGAGLPPFGFSFQKGADGAVLTVNMPPMDSSKLGMGALGEAAGKPGAKPDDAQAKQAMAMARMMMQGMFLDVTLAVDGRIRKTNAPYTSGSRVTLLQLDFDKMLQDATALDRMNSAKDLKSLQNIPGLKVPTDQKLTVEFGR